MKNMLVVLVFVLITGSVFSQKINEATRKKIYAVYSETAKLYREALKPVSSDAKDPVKVQSYIAQSLMIDTKLKYVISGFEKDITRKDCKNISRFVLKLNDAIKHEFTFPPGLNLPDQFFTDAKVKLEEAGLRISE